MKLTQLCTASAVTWRLLLIPRTTLANYHSPQAADAAPTVNVDALFQYTTSRNQKVITQAVDFVVSMQSAPTCTRMAASHLMNECKLLENAPDFAKPRPEAYLDNVKTEYAAKLAVCELLSAQTHNPTPPQHCEIFVPSSKACGKGGRWWQSNIETANDKQCYPPFKMYQYTQCLTSLQSKPQYWTSFSNAKQNAVVMCQASRDAIERENHLEIFKNLTQVLGGVTANMQQTTEDYESMIQEQRRFTNEAREANTRLKSDVAAIQLKAVATVTALDDKFHAFMKVSMSQLIAALADHEKNGIEQVHQRMQDFSQELIAESSVLAKLFTGQLERHHALALKSIQENHEAQEASYTVLSARMGNVQDTAQKTGEVANMSLAKMDSIAQRLDTFQSQTEHIAEGFAFLSAIPSLVALFVRGLLSTIGTLFLFVGLYKCNSRLALYCAGACCSCFLLHVCGVFVWLGNMRSNIDSIRSQALLHHLAAMSTTQTGMVIGILIWLGAYPIVCINSYLARVLETVVDQLIRPFFIDHYYNEGGLGLLPSIEVPAPVTGSKHNLCYGNAERYPNGHASNQTAAA